MLLRNPTNPKTLRGRQEGTSVKMPWRLKTRLAMRSSPPAIRCSSRVVACVGNTSAFTRMVTVTPIKDANPTLYSVMKCMLTPYARRWMPDRPGAPPCCPFLFRVDSLGFT
jgi:hypothetical protein